MSYEFRFKGDPILNEKAEVVEKIDDKIKYLAKRMFSVIESKKGIGLAAPQIGSSKRVVVIDTRLYEEGMRIALVNPEIVSHSENKTYTKEGCLSCPGFEKEIERWEEVMVKGKELNGEEVTIIFKGVSSRAIQQEIDHIDGILITDK